MKRGAMKKKVGGPIDKFNLIDNFALAIFCKWDSCYISLYFQANGSVINTVNFSTLEEVLVLALLPYKSRECKANMLFKTN